MFENAVNAAIFFSLMIGLKAPVMVGLLSVRQHWLHYHLHSIHHQNPKAHSHNLVQVKVLREQLLLQHYLMF
jgi:hypothetical protein